MARLVLTDSSPLIGLSRVDGLAWLRRLFGRVEMTPAVFEEVRAGLDLEAKLQGAVEEGWLVVQAPVPSPPAPLPHLGPGEWTTICVARSHPHPTLVLLDDRVARREARAAGLTVSGTAAVIGMARKRGLISSAAAVLRALQRSDFRLSDRVVQEVVEWADR